LWAGVIAFVICGWWYLRNFVIYREVLPLQAFQRAFAGTAQAQEMVAGMGGWFPYLQLIVTWTFQSFWAVFGNAKSAEKGIPLFLPEQIYWVLWGATLFVLAGITRLHWKRNTLFSTDQLRSLWVLFAAVLLVKLSFLGFVLKYFQAQGRYLYPAMLPICVVFALGGLALCPAKYRTGAGIAFLTLLGIYTTLFLSIIAP
jgi:hypothetical protein